MKTTIEINGHKYDARTGALIKDEPVVAAVKIPRQPMVKSKTNTAKFIDGITSVAHPTQPQKGDLANRNIPSKIINFKIPRPVRHLTEPARPVYRTVEKSKTLLRTVVKKPLVRPVVHSLTSPTSQAGTRPLNSGRPMPISTRRAERANQISRNPSVSRFANIPKVSLTRVVERLGVIAAPKVTESSPPPLIFGRKAAKADKPQVFNHRVTKINYQTSAKSPSEKLAKRLSRHVKIKPKALGVATAIVVILMLGSFLLYQTVPSIAMRVAARGAGFSGHLPEDIPAGYSFKGPIQYSKGIITLSYHSNTDDRRFTITQKPTNWTSDSLLVNYVLSKDPAPQTTVGSGLTIYVFNSENATWVDKGVWYSIAGEGSLSADQILSIAASF